MDKGIEADDSLEFVAQKLEIEETLELDVDIEEEVDLDFDSGQEYEMGKPLPQTFSVHSSLGDLNDHHCKNDQEILAFTLHKAGIYAMLSCHCLCDDHFQNKYQTGIQDNPL